jgi:sortase A
VSRGWRGADDDTVVLPVITDEWRADEWRTGEPRAGSGVGMDRPSPRPRSRHRRRKPTPTAGDRVRAALGVTGELLITMGLVVLLFVVYEVYITDWISANKQRDATAALDQQWSNGNGAPINRNQRAERFHPGEGEGFAKLYMPAFGSDFVFTVLEGTTERILEIGPGHYKGTAFPGEPGNFSIAGHRVGKGAPFNDLDLLRSCDALVVETMESWMVYRVLPMREEVAGWATGRGTDPQCEGVNPLGGPYTGTVGQQIVLPSQSGVVAPIPARPTASFSAVPPEERAALITLTTCHPRFSAAKRLVIHGVFVKQYPKNPANPGAHPPELTEG